MTAPAYYASGGDVMYRGAWVREEQIPRLLIDYAKEGNIAFDAGNWDVFLATVELSGQLKDAIKKAAQWSRASRALVAWGGGGLMGAQTVEAAADAERTGTPSPSSLTLADHRERLVAAVGGEEKFRQSFSMRTMSPERSATSNLDSGAAMWAQGLASISASGGGEVMAADWSGRFLRKWLAYQSAGARTANWMVTGPARFPVERNRKRMETEHKRLEELLHHVDGAGSWVRNRLRSAVKQAASEAAKASGVEHKEKLFDGGRVVLNKGIDRVQLVFDGKPAPDIIAELKRRAFRWSPREGAWQRQLTQNGVWAAESVVAAIAKALPAGAPLREPLADAGQVPWLTNSIDTQPTGGV